MGRLSEGEGWPRVPLGNPSRKADRLKGLRDSPKRSLWRTGPPRRGPHGVQRPFLGSGSTGRWTPHRGWEEGTAGVARAETHPVDSQNYGPLKSGSHDSRYRRQHCSSCGRHAPPHDGGSWEAESPGKGPSSPAGPGLVRPGSAASLPRPLRRALHLLGFPARAQRTAPQTLAVNTDEKTNGTSGEGEGLTQDPPGFHLGPQRPASAARLPRGFLRLPPGGGRPVCSWHTHLAWGHLSLTGTSASQRPWAPPATPEPTARSLLSGTESRALFLSGTEADEVTWASPERCEPPAQAPPGATCFAAREDHEAPGFTPRQLRGWGAGMVAPRCCQV